MKSSAVRLALTVGDPTGIGPEIAARLLSEAGPWNQHRICLLGDGPSLVEAFHRWGDPSHLVPLTHWSESTPPGKPGWYDAFTRPERHPEEVAPEVSAIRVAVEGCLNHTFDGLVTGPIAKDRLLERGFPYPGHTEYLGYLCDVKHPVMAFVSPRLRVALVSTHIPLSQVPTFCTQERILHTIQTCHRSLVETYGITSPHIVVCGLNPHAGERGHLGEEEVSTVEPAVRAARLQHINVTGPFPADSLFAQVVAGSADMVVALYHDQGLIPVKLLGFGQAVHLTLGLPILRTSVDHGVARDIAGQGRANLSGLRAALLEGIQLALRKK